MKLFLGVGRHIKTGALDELTLTTNGSQLAKYAEELRDCGVRRVNVSVDTLDPAKFTEITRRGRLDQVLEGLAAAKAAGLAVKINTVALRGVNEDELDDLVAWAGGEGFDPSSSKSCRWAISAANRLDQYLPLSWCARGCSGADLDERRAPAARRATRRCAEVWRLGFITDDP